MSFSLVQKSSDSDLTTPACDGLPDEFIKQMDGDTGTATNITISIAKSATECLKFVVSSGILRKLDWEKGTFTWRLKVVTANANLSIIEVVLRRVSSTGTVKSTKSSGTLSVSLGTTGVKSGDILWEDESLNPSGKDMMDRLEVVYKIKNSKTTAQTAAIETNVEVLTTPILFPKSSGVKIGGFV